MIIQGLSKIHKLKKVVDTVDWQVGAGVFGLIGPTNSGKSILLKILSGNLRPGKGDVSIDGINLSSHPDEYRHKVGYLPQDFSPHNDWSIDEYMIFTAILKGLRKNRNQAIKAILEQVELWDARHRKLNTLPIGMMKRLGAAQALLNEPNVLLLDEPTAGLSPLERSSLLKLVCAYGKNHTVIFSSQSATDIIKCCRKVTIMNSGGFIFSGSLKEIIQMAQHSMGLDLKNNAVPENTLTLAFIDGYQHIVGGILK